MTADRKVLIITYYWPPVSSPGVQRWLKFIKYLPEYGLTPIVVTVQNPGAPSTDATLQEDVDPDLEVIVTKSLEPIQAYNMLRGKPRHTVEVGLGSIQDPTTVIDKVARSLRSNIFIPDAKIGWYYRVRKNILNLVQSRNIQTIITTGPPHTTHLIGSYIKARSDVKWIVDLRDPWTGIYYDQYLRRSKWAARRNQMLEQKILQQADQLVVVTRGMARELAPYAAKTVVIPNGYDEADFAVLTASDDPRLTIAYTGNLKANQNVTTLWSELSRLLQIGAISPDNFRLLLVGNIHPVITRQLTSSGIDAIVERRPFVQHDEAIAIMAGANVLLLPIPHTKGNRQIVTGKIYEYLASRTAILAIGPPTGDADQILQETGRAPVIDYDDIVGMKDRLTSYIQQWAATGSVPKCQGEVHTKYARQGLTRDVADLITV